MPSTAVLTSNALRSRGDKDTATIENAKKFGYDSDTKMNTGDRKNNVITPQKKKSKKNSKLRAKIVATTKTSLDRRMSVEKNVVDELLLVCGVIGTTADSGTKNELVPVTDCLNWLQDLQRALRRDEDLYRPISLLLGKWKIVEQKLLPLVVTCRYDTPIVLTVLKILVILTKPLAENSQRAGQMIIDTASAKSDPAVVAQQIKLRQNALAQAEQLMEYKRMITFHPSNYQGNKKQKNKGTGILSVFVSLLAEPLSKTGASRTDADHLTIELVLHLIRNLLSAQPLLNSSSETSRQASQLHQDMIVLFEKELVLEILLVVGQEMELRENTQYNLLMMEILHHMVKAQDPTAVARSFLSTSSNEPTKPTASGSNTNRFGVKPKGVMTGSSALSSPTPSSALASKLKQERSMRRNMKSVRHGHFSGTWMRKQVDGRRQFVGASNVVQGGKTVGGASQNRCLVQARRNNRSAEPFIGSGKSLLAHTRSPLQFAGSTGGPATKRANTTMHEFCKRFLTDCYGPFMKSIKNEFRRDSQRLEEKDKIVFFKLVWFFSQWSRVFLSSSSRNSNTDNDEAIGRLIITMDVFTFNLVLAATETFYQQKKHTRLAQTVALYAEMMHLLHSMYTSKDKTEHEMAMGLIDRLFYHGKDSMDQLPKLLNRWAPGIYTREYLCDLVEVAHVSLKVLEANAKRGMEFLENANDETSNAGKGKISQKISKMRRDAAEFDLKGYFVRKIVSNQLVSMYGHLLNQYKINAAVVNHRIITMFLRVTRLEIANPDIADVEESISPLGTRRVTLEPMLYNIQLLMVIERILNDDSIEKDKSFDSLAKFGTTLMHKFWSAADSNPMLYVECLFQHSAPHRFCESVTNMYVNDELRMMAEREMLREDQMREHMEHLDDREKEGLNGHDGNDDDDDDEAELEFTGILPQSSSNERNAEDEYQKTRNGCEEEAPAERGDENDTPSAIAVLQSRKRTREAEYDSSDEELFASAAENEPTAKKRKSAFEEDTSDENDDANEHPTD